ncbi:thiamine pyrophosphate-dependent dehydrogenase E1 component subunit alpha [candidate division KSB1 bacterium]|nr:thiamine pyrophosphate-dependent dehydrogenase E1 component subunit alpha [candidate division KSB1 bacterium]
MIDIKILKNLYKTMYTIRTFELQCIKLYRQGEIRGYFHPYLGEEAIAAGVCAALGGDDYITSTHRGHGHCIARGADLDRMTAELLGKKTGYCRGLGGSMHIADFTGGNLGANGIVGGGIAMGVGAGLSCKTQDQKGISVIFTSDGASNNGIFMESLNLAAIWKLPVLLVIENNQYAVSTPIEDSTAESDLYKRGIGIGVDSFQVDGNDVIAVYSKSLEAVKKCRNGQGPILMEAKTYRHGGHHVNDPGLYMPKDRLEYYKSRDPLILCREYLTETAQVKQDDLERIQQEVESEMDQAIEFAAKSPELTLDEFKKMTEVY